MVTNIIGSACLKIKDYEQAKIYYEKTIKLNQKFSEGYYNLGYTYWLLGRSSLAEKYCFKAIKTKANNHLLGFVYDLLGMLAELKNDIKNAKKYPKLDPRYIFMNQGFNLRPSDIQAAMGSSQLKRLGQFIKIRTSNRERIINLSLIHI